MTDAQVAGLVIETMGVPTPPEAQVGGLLVEVMGVPQSEAVVHAAFIEVMGVPRTDVITHGFFIEVMGKPLRGIPNVAGSGVLQIKHPDGTWHTAVPIA